jgi:hypothetical protein
MTLVSKLVPLLLALVAATTPALALTVVVRDIDTKKGIVANIILATAPPNEVDTPFGTTDDSGTISKPSFRCTNQFVKVQPFDSDYSEPAYPGICSGPRMVVLLRSSSQLQEIKILAVTFEREGKYGVAAQAYNEVLAAEPTNLNQSAVLLNVAHALKVPEHEALVLDPDQGKRVMSPELHSRVIEFQRRQGLAPDGIVGSQTLHKIAKGSVEQNVLSAKSD